MEFYFDNPEIGPAPETSHPNYVSKFKGELYYDCLDDFSPFGNDDGADALCELEDWYRGTKGKKKILKWAFAYIDEMGFEYESENAHKLVIDISAISQLDDEDITFFRAIDNVVIAVAFGQYKITGQIDAELKDAALLSIKRLKTITTKDDTAYFEEFVAAYDQMERDIASLASV